MLVSSSVESVRQNIWDYKTILNSTSPYINWELLLIPGLNCTMWVMSPQMCLLWKFNIPFLVNPASLVKNTWLLKRESDPYCQRNLRQRSWLGQKSYRLRACTCHRWYRYSNCSPHHSHAQHIFSSLYTVNTVQEFSSVYLSMLFHIYCSCTPPCSMVNHRRVNSTGPPDVAISKFGSWGFLSMYNLTVSAPLPLVLPRINCISMYSWSA